MSHRLHLGLISKTERRKLNEISLIDFETKYKKDDILPIISQLPSVKPIFMIGSHYDKDLLNGVDSKPLFENKDLHESYNLENTTFITNQDGLKSIINYYIEQTKQYYQEVLNGTSKYQTSEERMTFNFQNKLDFWKYDGPTLTNNDNEYLLAYSDNIEIEVFNLLHLLKTIDWDFYDLLVYSY